MREVERYQLVIELTTDTCVDLLIDPLACCLYGAVFPGKSSASLSLSVRGWVTTVVCAYSICQKEIQSTGTPCGP